MPTLTRSRFETRFAPYQQRLYGYAVAMTRDRDAARDLLHDCVARAVSARDCPADEPAFRAWLFTIMRNQWIDHVRAQRRRDSVEAALYDAMAVEPVSLESTVVNSFAVRQAFDLLSHDHREVLALVDISGFSYHETAALLDIAPGTVMSRVSRARSTLVNLLADKDPTVVPLSRNANKT